MNAGLSTVGKCRIAFVGAGYMTTEHLKAFRDIPSVELSGIYSRTASRAESLAKEFGIGAICRSMGELHDRTGAHLVVISVPELSTRPVCEAAVAYPWTLLIEKPAGYDVADAESISHAAKQAGVQAFVALNRRHYSSTRTALLDLASNDAPRFVQVQDQQDAAAAARSGQPPLVVKNWMYANSIHLVDYFASFCRGKVTGVTPLFRWNAGEPALVVAGITFDSGDRGLYEAVWNSPGPWAISITTGSKRWELRPLENASFQLYGQRTLEAVETGEWDRRFKPGLRRQAELAVSAALGATPKELPTLDDALASMYLTQAIYE